MNYTDSSKYFESYYEVKVSDKIATYGGCPAWQRYTSGDLSYSSLFQVPNMLRILVASTYFSSDVDEMICSDRTVAGQILDKIITPPTFGTTSSFTCQNHVWRVRDCANNGYASFCVDCTNPCSKDFCTPSDPFYIGPCGTSGTSCSFPSAYVRIFDVEFLDTRDVFPTISSSTKVVSRTGVRLNLALSGPGVVSCAIFSATTTPTSTAQIVLQKYTATAVNNAVSFNFTGLVPVTSYNIYCYSTSTSGSAMTLADALGTKMTITTDCCREITLTLGIAFLYQNEQSLNALTLSTSAQIPEGVTVTLFAQGPSGIITPMQPSSVTLSTALSTTASIAVANTAVVGVVTVLASVVNNTAYSVVFANAKNTFVVQVAASRQPAPTLMSAVFSPTGSSIIVTYSSPTDQAGRTSSAAFACSTLFLITDRGTPTCQWQSSSVLVMTPVPNSQLAVRTEIVGLGGTLRSPCTLARVVCQSWDTVSARVLRLAAPANAITPTGK